jgi:hypothetical protein
MFYHFSQLTNEKTLLFRLKERNTLNNTFCSHLTFIHIVVTEGFLKTHTEMQVGANPNNEVLQHNNDKLFWDDLLIVNPILRFSQCLLCCSL